MLVISRKSHEKIRLSGGVVITITRIEGNKVGVGIEAPHSVCVVRSKPCVVCGYPTFDCYLDYYDIPFCGDVRCGNRIRMNREPQEVKT